MQEKAHREENATPIDLDRPLSFRIEEEKVIRRIVGDKGVCVCIVNHWKEGGRESSSTKAFANVYPYDF